MNLERHERERFMAWCLQEAGSAEQMVEAAKNLDPKTAEMIARKYKTEALALRLVAGYLSFVEEVTLGRQA